MKIIFISMSSYGEGISGGDRIYIEFARNWMKKNKVEIVSWEEGLQMLNRQNFPSKLVKIRLLKMYSFNKLGFLINYFARILRSVLFSIRVTLETEQTIIYSSSEFLMDTLPAFILKLRYPKIVWVATWYQTAPNPIKGYSEIDRKDKHRLNSFLYWISQTIIKPFISSKADFVLVNNEIEKKQFPNLNKKNKVIVVIGAVAVEKINKWIKKNRLKKDKKYLAVFQGRFHAQKGVVEMIEIWKEVVKKLPGAKLAMVGDGPLMQEVKKKILEYSLEKNIDILGYMFDGNKKYQVFSESYLVVHPAFYDSGGMAAAEAMAFGIPVVGFDLKSYSSYYPKGMLKIKKGSLKNFSKAIISLAKNKDQYQKYAKDAKNLIQSQWSWETRASEVMSKINI